MKIGILISIALSTSFAFAAIDNSGELICLKALDGEPRLVLPQGDKDGKLNNENPILFHLMPPPPSQTLFQKFEDGLKMNVRVTTKNMVYRCAISRSLYFAGLFQLQLGSEETFVAIDPNPRSSTVSNPEGLTFSNVGNSLLTPFARSVRCDEIGDEDKSRQFLHTQIALRLGTISASDDFRNRARAELYEKLLQKNVIEITSDAWNGRETINSEKIEARQKELESTAAKACTRYLTDSLISALSPRLQSLFRAKKAQQQDGGGSVAQ